MAEEEKNTDGIKTDTKDGDDSGASKGSEKTGSKDELSLEKLKAELDEMKKANSSKDSKIAEYQRKQKQLEKDNFDKKTSDEKVNELAEKVKSYEQKEAFTKAFKSNGLDPDLFMDIINEISYDVQAQKFSTLLAEQVKKASEKAIEDFKTKELEKIRKGGTKNHEDSTTDPNAQINNSIRAALGR